MTNVFICPQTSTGYNACFFKQSDLILGCVCIGRGSFNAHIGYARSVFNIAEDTDV